MAKRNGNSGETAGGRLETLRAQIGALWARKRELTTATAQPDGDDPLAWVARAGAAGAELAAIDKALPMLEAEVRAAADQLRAAQEAEQAAAAERMRAEIPDRLRVVVDAVAALDVALGGLLSHEQAIRALGGWVPASYTAGLRQAVNGFRGEMRREYPDLVGLPAKLSRQQELLLNARAELKQREEGLAKARQVDEGPRHEYAADKKRLVKAAERAVARARQHVTDCEAGPVKAGPVEAGPVEARPDGDGRPDAEPRPDPVVVLDDRGRASYWED